MIDVLKRIAELDAQNPNIVKESTQVDECGIMPEMGMMGMGHEHAPVPANLSLNASGASGEEVANMLTQIMTLAGVHKVGPQDLGIEQEPLTAEPEVSGPAPTAGDEMRSVIDKLNPDADDSDEEDDEETDESQYDNSPADATDLNTFGANDFAHRENQPGQGDRMDGTAPKAFKTNEQIEQDLWSDYKNFVSES